MDDLNNDDVYDFLARECREDAGLWAEYGEGILAHTTDADFWDSLSEHLDCMRVCDECGKPMIEGFVVDGYLHYCSEGCLLKHMSWDRYLELYDDGEGDSYWTTWFDDSKIFGKMMKR